MTSNPLFESFFSSLEIAHRPDQGRLNNAVDAQTEPSETHCVISIRPPGSTEVPAGQGFAGYGLLFQCNIRARLVRSLAHVQFFRILIVTIGVVLALSQFPVDLLAQSSHPRTSIEQAMKKAASFYRTHVATHGGYVYHYDLDLNRRWGEGEATKDQIWVQPPGTPTVGLAYIEAYRATGDSYYLAAVRETAHALAYGQLRSGGWTNCIDFDPAGKRVNQYVGRPKRGKDNSSLDDGQTQTALRFLMQADSLFEFKDRKIHDCAVRGLEALLSAQLPSGAFPQVWTSEDLLTPNIARQAVPGTFPKYDWKTEGRIKEYWTQATLNDDVALFTYDTLSCAEATYDDPRCEAAILRLGDFLVAAQMPEPQPAWAQQYNDMGTPIWARAFEPPAIASSESQGIVELLLKLYVRTQDDKYLLAARRAIDYLERSRLDDGRLARYYELETNRPLYMQRSGKTYSLTYSDRDLPSHYGWKIDSKLEALRASFLKLEGPVSSATSGQGLELSEDERLSRASEIIGQLDAQGRWVSQHDGRRLVGQTKFAIGERYLSSQKFSENLTLLARALGIPSSKL